jgi:tyrosyl-tRNA synthetase
MSKSLGNYVGINEAPSDMFGKLMSVPDSLMWRYYELLTDLPQYEIDERSRLCGSGQENPITAKRELAHFVVAQFHGQSAADSALKNFITVFSLRLAPEEVEEIIVKNMLGGHFYSYRNPGVINEQKRLSVSSTGIEKWSRLLSELELVSSTSEGERIIKQRGFEVDGKLISDPSARINLKQPATLSLKIGKRKFLRIVVE